MTIDSVKQEIKTWYSSPYAANMDAAHWFIFLGFLICCMIAWRMGLAAISREV